MGRKQTIVMGYMFIFFPFQVQAAESSAPDLQVQEEVWDRKRLLYCLDKMGKKKQEVFLIQSGNGFELMNYSAFETIANYSSDSKEGALIKEFFRRKKTDVLPASRLLSALGGV